MKALVYLLALLMQWLILFVVSWQVLGIHRPNGILGFGSLISLYTSYRIMQAFARWRPGNQR